MRVRQIRVCLWFSANGFGICDDRSIWDSGITQAFCLVLVNDGEILVYYPLFLFLFLFLLFFIQSMFGCWQLSALKRTKLHVLARMSATNLVILFTHFLFPCGHFSPWKFNPLCLSSLSVSAGPSPEEHSPVFTALCKRNYIRVANIWQDMKAKIQSCSCVRRSSWPFWTCIVGMSMIDPQQKFS